jgi:hypothetical protein
MCQSTSDLLKSSAANKSNDTNSHGTSNIPSPILTTDSDDYYTFPNNSDNKENTTVTKSEQQMTTARKVIYTILWLVLTYLSKEFAKFLSIYQSQAATKTFIVASYQYDEENTFFDNTFLTYGTDFFISILMTYASYKCYSTHIPLGYKGSALFASYAISVFSGGYAHATFTSEDIDSMNTMKFRLIWIVCVGTVTAAGGFMGMCGSETLIFFNRLQLKQKESSTVLVERRFSIGQIISNSLWWVYGIFMTTICIMGEISYKRPACDIFVAGTTQFIPTVYCILVLLSIRWADAIPLLEGKTTTKTATTTPTNKISPLFSRGIRIPFYLGFALNAPLLPSYPLLVQYTNLSLGAVNAIMHLNLTYSWGMQAWSIYQLCLIMKKEDETRVESSKKIL